MTVFPFDAVVGQDDAKLALRLAAADARIGGVLLRGEKGSAKTTLARGLAGLLGDAPFVELPLGATEDRVVGSLDTRAALVGEGVRFEPGLLAAADGGVLYVDEINLLADHLVDVLLDVAVSGRNVVERDGISHHHPARFVLVGSMNPEEGELRPQLLDRFGLCVEVRAPTELVDRIESVRRRLAFDAGEAPPGAAGPRPSPAGTTPAGLPEAVLEAASRLALAVAAEGLRADLTLCRAAAALAGLEGRDKADVDDLRRVAPLALAHRSRRGPFDPPVLPPDELADALNRALTGSATGGGPDDDQPDDPGATGQPDPGSSDDPGAEPGPEPGSSDDPGAEPGPEPGSSDDPGPEPGPDPGSSDDPGLEQRGGRARAPAERQLVLGRARRPPLPPPRQVTSARGRVVSERLAGPADEIALVPTVRSLAATRSRAGGAGAERTGAAASGIEPDDLRTAVRVGPRQRTIVLCVDLSGSMGGPERAAAASGTVLGLLDRAYQQRERVALVGFRDKGATVLLSPTASVEVARNRLDDLTTGGATPLADGIVTGLAVAERASGPHNEVLLVLLSDGRATGSPEALDRALDAAGRVRRAGIASLVLDCETGRHRLGLAATVAEAMGAEHVHVDSLDPDHLARTIRSSP